MSTRIVSGSLAVMAALLLVASPALAATYHLFGDAEIVSPGNNSPHAVEADGTTTGSGILFDIPAGTTFGQIDQLSTDYLFTAGNCTAGSPRFQVRVFDPVQNRQRNIFVYSHRRDPLAEMGTRPSQHHDTESGHRRNHPAY